MAARYRCAAGLDPRDIVVPSWGLCWNVRVTHGTAIAVTFLPHKSRHCVYPLKVSACLYGSDILKRPGYISVCFTPLWGRLLGALETGEEESEL